MSYYKIKNLEQYFKHYNKSVREPKKFWGKIAEENFIWDKYWNKELDFNLSEGSIKWFLDAKLNITKNCIDRHLSKRGEKTAIIFEPNNPNEEAKYITYKKLHNQVCRMANVLRNKGIRKGDRVCIYLPMLPELVVSILACARIGAVHCVIFAGLSASAVSERLIDSSCKIVITSDGEYRGDKIIDLKSIIDEALEDSTFVEKVLVVKRTQNKVKMIQERDFWLQPLLDEVENFDDVIEIMDSEDLLFILYNSNSIGKPKGIVHTIGGYMVYTAYSFRNVFNYEEGDIFWCTADIGWIIGHSYALYGPLLNGATTVLFEGIPSYPDFGRFWEIIAKHKVNQFYSSSTIISSLVKENFSWINNHDLSSLKVLGSSGEPINKETWHWYNNHVGKKKSPIVDTWGQTETGSILISPIALVTPIKPTYITLPLPGIQPVLFDDKFSEIEKNQIEGNLCIKFPWPSIARTIWNDHQLYIDTYFKMFSGMYFTGERALRDEVGYYKITGRLDDVVNVSGRNLGIIPIEGAINEHPSVAESAVIGFSHKIKGDVLYGFVSLKNTEEEKGKENLIQEINTYISSHIDSYTKLDKIQFVSGLPKTRSGKIVRKILRGIAEDGTYSSVEDMTFLINPEVVVDIAFEKI